MFKISRFLGRKYLRSIPILGKLIFNYLKIKNPISISDLNFETSYSNSYSLISEKRSKNFQKINNRLKCYLGSVQGGPNKEWEYPWVLSNLRLKKGLKLLDVGCGISPIQYLLSDIGINVYGIDPYVDVGWHGLNKRLADFFGCSIKYRAENAKNLSFDENTFDRVCCISVMEHVWDKEVENPQLKKRSKEDLKLHKKIMHEMIRVLKPGGLCVVTLDFYIPRDNVLLESNTDVKNLMDIEGTKILGKKINVPFFGEENFNACQIIKKSNIDIVNYCDKLQTSIGFTLQKL